VYRNVYLPKGEQLTPVTRAVAAWLWSGRRAVLVGTSAAALHRVKWIDLESPAELSRVEGSSNGITVYRDSIRDHEVCLIDEMKVTTPARTAFDLGRRHSGTEAVIRVDALANATRLGPDEVRRVASWHHGARGIGSLRDVVDMMDAGAESPQETRTRQLLVRAGFRRPQTQIVVHDEYGLPFARIDMGWKEFLVGVEYDGPQHWTDPSRRTRDIDKYAELGTRGWRIVRVSNDLLRERPGVVVRRTCAALEAAGCSWLDECGGVDPRFVG
jgi:very-short-patch-repair endonuclease